MRISRVLCALAITLASACARVPRGPAAVAYDVLITNARIVDGTGNQQGVCVLYVIDPHADPSDPGACVGVSMDESTPIPFCEGLQIDTERPCLTTDSGFIIVCNE